ncbi:MAG: metallophosphoesterase family protein [bacterium]|nr:metallophosphoesterase family protein [bacterium]
MKIAFISDIHGNLEALQTALKVIDNRRVDEVICLGDIVGYGANPAECLDLVRSVASRTVLGNHDASVSGQEGLDYFNDFARAAVTWTQSMLTSDQMEYLRSLPLSLQLEHLHLVHGTPGNPQKWEYIFSSYDAARQFSFICGKVCFVGHSHVPGDYHEKWRDHLSSTEDRVTDAPSSRRIVNIGSVGQPRDRDPRLCFVVYDTEMDHVEFVREEYNVEAAAGKIRRAGLPEFLADRLLWGW